jgi:hypothetical protein
LAEADGLAASPRCTFVEDEKPGEDNGTDSKAFGRAQVGRELP